ncbi:DUF4279 domain-containing protein [Dactylosporangium sp. NPDC000244]|uniref:DUF4279 domain-containing protein n=1 Tax=Dactylosporangium sp. NPDC000244 TaxID=3154365 RepID=UPI003316DA09
MVTFRLFGGGENGSADDVTAHLGLRPSHVSRDGLGWLLCSASGAEDGVELAVQLRRLLDILEPVTGRLWELVGSGYEANWLCYLGSHATEHAAELDRDTMRRLLGLPGDLWLDVYDEEPSA